MRRILSGGLLALALLAGCGDGYQSVSEKLPVEPLKALWLLPPGRGYVLPPGRGYILARVRTHVLVHDRPGGRPIARLRPKTPFGEPRTLAILATREEGRWLGVHSPVLGNENIGWIENDNFRLALTRTEISLHIDLSRKQVELKSGRDLARRFPIAIGKAGTSTPDGRFQVTDKLAASRVPAAYGCCILALSARQPNLPSDWPGGDRIAIHGTLFDQTIGSASSNGCLRAADADLRVLMREVPVGAPVFIRH